VAAPYAVLLSKDSDWRRQPLPHRIVSSFLILSIAQRDMFVINNLMFIVKYILTNVNLDVIL